MTNKNKEITDKTITVYKLINIPIKADTSTPRENIRIIKILVVDNNVD